MKSAVVRSPSFQAVRGMLFELKPETPKVGDKLDVISCENSDYYIKSCPLERLKVLSEREFELLCSIPDCHDRISVCNPSPQGKSKLQQGLEAKQGDIVEIYNETGNKKTGIGYIKSIGHTRYHIVHDPGSKMVKGVYFEIIKDDGLYLSDSQIQPEIQYLPLHRLEFIVRNNDRNQDKKRGQDHLNKNQAVKHDRFPLSSDSSEV